MKPIILLLSLCSLMCSCGATSQPKASTATPVPTSAPLRYYKVGETATIQPWEITLQSATLTDAATYLPSGESMPDANAGDQLLVLGEQVKNISAQVLSFLRLNFAILR